MKVKCYSKFYNLKFNWESNSHSTSIELKLDPHVVFRDSPSSFPQTTGCIKKKLNKFEIAHNVAKRLKV